MADLFMNELTRKKIVVADDDDAIADALRVILELEGHEVTLTKNIDTIDTICRVQPDLVLLDIWMAGVDGRNICSDLKQNDITKHIPILLVSASRNAHVAVKDCNADGFIAKPFEMSDLIREVSLSMARNKQIAAQ